MSIYQYANLATILATAFALGCIALAYALHRHRRKTCNAKISYVSIESRCRSICCMIEEVWPDIGALRGELFVSALRGRIMDAELLREHVQGILDDRPGKKSFFDSIEAVQAAGAKLGELQRVRSLLDEANIGNAGLGLPSKAGVSERVSLICNMVKRMKGAVSAPGVSPAFVWIPAGLEKKAADMLCGFATTLANKMYASQEKIRKAGDNAAGWGHKTTEWPLPWAQESLLHHVGKGDPVDVALFAAFLWFHKAPTSLLNYMSVTPALEQALRLVQTGVSPDALNVLAESKLKPHFVPEYMGDIPRHPAHEARPGQLEGSEEIPCP